MGKTMIKVGFGKNNEVEQDIWDDEITERPYRADIISNNRRFEQMDTLSGGVQISNQFSVVGDSFLFDHLEDIRYVRYKNTNWIPTTNEAYPRVTFQLGGLYNGPTPTTE